MICFLLFSAFNLRLPEMLVSHQPYFDGTQQKTQTVAMGLLLNNTIKKFPFVVNTKAHDHPLSVLTARRM